MDQKDDGSEDSSVEQDKLQKLSGIIYVSIILLSALGWLIYFKVYRRSEPKIEGVVWSRGPFQQEQSYFTIIPPVPGSPKGPKSSELLDFNQTALDLPMPGLVYSTAEDYQGFSKNPPSYQSCIPGPK